MFEIKKTDIKKKRTLKVFIDATAKIIENEGINGVTIRKVAKITGYNSATIYNYFDNLKQLISFASIKFINEYVQALPDYMNQSDNTLERFLLMWECFCKHCFANPKIYYAVFTSNIGKKHKNLISNYYSLFPEEMGHPPEDLMPMLLTSDFSKRNELAIKPCIEEGYFTEEEGAKICEMSRLIYQGMLSLIINDRVNHSAKEATKKTMTYIRMTVENMISSPN